MEDYRVEMCLSAEEIAGRIDAIAARIDRDYEGRELLVVGILKGAFIFMADLVRRLKAPVEVDFVRVRSYGRNTESSGDIELTKDVEASVEGRDVLLVEDIVDSGRTLAWLADYFNRKGPASVRICALIDKKERREAEVNLDYVALEVEEGFLVGYGLDYAEKHRNLPGICVVRFSEGANG